MRHLKYFKTHSEYLNAIANNLLITPSVSFTKDTVTSTELKSVFFDVSKVTMQQIINEGYAEVYSMTGGTDYGLGDAKTNSKVIRILPTCPYSFADITDIEDVAFNVKKLYDGYNNILVWSNATTNGYTHGYCELPSGITNADIINMYNGKTIDYLPSSGFFDNVDFSDVDTFEFGFSKATTYKVNATGLFRNASSANKSTPKNIIVNMPSGGFSSIWQRMFQYCSTTEHITIRGGYVGVQTPGFFEYCYNLKDIVFDCEFNWNDGNLVKNTSNMFHNCSALKVVPLKSSLAPTEANRIAQTLKPGDNNNLTFMQMFMNCAELECIMPVLDFNIIRPSDLTTDGGTFTGCDKLSDIRIKNLNNADWDFINIPAYSLINIDAASIEFMLNNVADVTSTPHYIELSNKHESEISASAISNATSKGWDVRFLDPNPRHSFSTWEVVSSALADYDLTGSTLTIRKFKPNTVLLKYVPSVESGSTMNQAVFDYLHEFNVNVSGFTGQVGDTTNPISWYKTNNDAGGYFCRGFLVSPINSSNRACVTVAPWEMGVGNGEFKKPNSGWQYYGYTYDGAYDMYSYNSTHTYPENAATGAGLFLFSGSSVDGAGYITLNSPITIKLF